MSLKIIIDYLKKINCCFIVKKVFYKTLKEGSVDFEKFQNLAKVSKN